MALSGLYVAAILLSVVPSHATFQFAVVLSTALQDDSFYGGGSPKETQSAVSLALQQVNDCQNILPACQVVAETILTNVSSDSVRRILKFVKIH